MTDMTIPAPVISTGGTDSAAPQVTTQNTQAEQIATTPQAATPPDGNPQAATPDGQEPEKKTWEEKRKERNRERWQQYKQAKEVIPQRLAMIERQLAQLNSAPVPDFSQITDPAEELAAKTAHRVKAEFANDARNRAQEEQRQIASEYEAHLAAAASEMVESAREKFPDFEQVMSGAPIHDRAVRHIVESENAEEIAYYLGKNRAEAAQLYQMFDRDPYSALIRFGQLQAKVAAAPAKSPTTAPRPATVLSGGQSPLAFDAQQASVADMAAHLKKAGLIR